MDNIGGEVGSIPPYPTCVPPSPKNMLPVLLTRCTSVVCDVTDGEMSDVEMTKNHFLAASIQFCGPPFL